MDFYDSIAKTICDEMKTKHKYHIVPRDKKAVRSTVIYLENHPRVFSIVICDINERFCNDKDYVLVFSNTDPSTNREIAAINFNNPKMIDIINECLGET